MKTLGQPTRSTSMPENGMSGISTQPMMLTMLLASASE